MPPAPSPVHTHPKNKFQKVGVFFEADLHHASHHKFTTKPPRFTTQKPRFAHPEIAKPPAKTPTRHEIKNCRPKPSAQPPRHPFQPPRSPPQPASNSHALPGNR